MFRFLELEDTSYAVEFVTFEDDRGETFVSTAQRMMDSRFPEDR